MSTFENNKIKFEHFCVEEPELSKLLGKFGHEELRDILALAIESDNIAIFKIIIKFIETHPGTWKRSIKNYIKTINAENDQHLYKDRAIFNFDSFQSGF
jgi:DNA-binding Lrp family transcriptional regulator